MISLSSVADWVGRAVLHSVWEDALLAMLFFVAGTVLRKNSPRVRYGLGCATLLLMLIAPIVTILARPVTLVTTAIAVGDVQGRAETIHVAPATLSTVPPTVRRSTPTLLQITATAWAIGLAAVSVWQLAGWVTVRNLLRWSQPADASRTAQLRRLCDRMRIRSSIAMRVCDQLSTPAMVGWVRPVILIPPAALCDLPAAYFESLLLHELAHIRRHDYLINLLQAVAETILFYHPAAWWMSRVVRQERENCCDDEAVRQSGRTIYIRALAMMESLRADDMGSLALPATGGNLLRRIERLVGVTNRRRASNAGAIALLSLLGMIVIVSASYAARADQQSERKPATTQPATSQPLPEQHGSARDAILPEDLQEPVEQRRPATKSSEPVIHIGDYISVRAGIAENRFAQMGGKVTPEGTLKLSLYRKDFAAAGLTAGELTDAITAAHNQTFKGVGKVEVFWAGMSVSRPPRPEELVSYTVTGSRLGGQKQASNRSRLLEAVMDAKGKNEPRAQRIYVIRKDAEHANALRHIEIPVEQLLAGDVSCNIVLRDGDEIVVEPTK